MDHSVDTKEKDNGGWTAFSLASKEEHIEILVLLIECGASIKTKCNDDWTTLHEAAVHRHTETVILIVDRGSNVDTKNNHGDTVFQTAAHGGQPETVRLLMDRITNVDTNKNYGCIHSTTWLIMGIRRPSGSSLTEIRTSTPRTMMFKLHRAACYRHMDAFILLMDLDANVDTKENDGKTVLDLSNNK